mgnify:CR=1 FL=1
MAKLEMMSKLLNFCSHHFENSTELIARELFYCLHLATEILVSYLDLYGLAA